MTSFEAQAFFQDKAKVYEDLTSRSKRLLEKGHPTDWIQRKLQTDLHPQQKSHLEKLLKGQAQVVITGQQPCLLGGASLTLHKILHTLSLCRDLQSQGFDVVPLFWSASEDHDLYEMLRVELWHHDFSPKLYKLSHLERGFSAETFAEPTELHQQLQDQLSPFLKEAFFSKPAHRFVDPFHHALNHLFGHHGLIVVEPKDFADTTFDFWSRVQDRAPDLVESYQHHEQALQSKGLPIQAPRRRGLPVFALNHKTGERTPFNYDGQFQRDQASNASKDLLSLLKPDERLSPGALLRPILAQSQLPILISVLGPAEYLYHQQLLGAYTILDCEVPLLWPRSGGTWVPQSLSELFNTELKNLDLYVQTSQAPHSPNALLDLPLYQKLGQSLQSLQEHFRHELEPGHGVLQRFIQDLNKAHYRMERGLKKTDLKKQGWASSKVQLLESLLRPKGQPQERRLGWAQFLNSEQKIAELLETFKDPFDFSHRIYR